MLTFETSSSSARPKSECGSSRFVFVGALIGVLLIIVVAISESSVGKNNKPYLKENAQVLHSPAASIMGSDALNKAYNIFRGKGASAEVAHQIVQFSTKLNNTVDWGDTVYWQPDQIDLTINARCHSHTASKTAFGLDSSAQTSSIATEESSSLDVSAKGQYGPVRGSVDASMAFGNKNSMKSARKAKTENYGSMSRSYVMSSLYDATVAWDDEHLKLMPELHQELLGLTFSSLFPQRQVAFAFLRFFERFGTHVIARGVYGSKCSLSTFISKTATEEEVSNELTAESTGEFAMKMFAEYNGVVASGSVSASGKKSNKKNTGSTQLRQSATKIEAKVTDITCKGYVQDNLCNEQFNARYDNPAMISYRLIPIWHVKAITSHFPKQASALSKQFEMLKNETSTDPKCKYNGCYIAEGFWDQVADSLNPWSTWKADLHKAVTPLGPSNGQFRSALKFTKPTWIMDDNTVYTANVNTLCQLKGMLRALSNGQPIERPVPLSAKGRSTSLLCYPPSVTLTWVHAAKNAACVLVCKEVQKTAVVSPVDVKYPNLVADVCRSTPHGTVGYTGDAYYANDGTALPADPTNLVLCRQPHSRGVISFDCLCFS